MSRKMILIAGPCVIESEKQIFEIAEELKKISQTRNVEFFFKTSFDKANRTSISSYRGPGIEEGLRILEKVKKEFDINITTDVHEVWQIKEVAPIVDMIQIPAFLCRQTDLLVAAGKTGKIINVKKGQFLSPLEVTNIVTKIENTGNKNIMICERGTTFGYNRLVVDMTGIYEMKKLGYPIVIDATHSTQMPGEKGNATGGHSEYAETLAKAAIAAGADATFFEVHPNPKMALSDGTNMVALNSLDDILERVLKVYDAVKNER